MNRKTPFAVLAVLTAAATQAGHIDRALEARIHQAVSPVAAKMKLVRDTSAEARETAAVSYADVENCRAASACTALAVYYTKSRNCGKVFGGEWGFVDNGGEGGARNYYNTAHGGVCYQISTHHKQDAQAVARALKAVR